MIKAVRRLSTFFLFLTQLINAVAQSPQDVANGLKDKTVLLRENSGEDKIAFDLQGDSTGKFSPGPFALSGIEIKKVHVADNSVHIEGNRALLIYPAGADTHSADAIRLAPLNQTKVGITIALDLSRPEALMSAVKKIFANTPAEVLSSQTAEQRRAALYTIAALSPPDSTKLPRPLATSDVSSGIYSVSKGVTPPHVTYSVDPELTAKAEHDHFGGISVISITVDRNGFPTHARVMRTLEPGLDENAILAVSQFRFKPAVFQGKPLAVQVVIEMNFHPH